MHHADWLATALDAGPDAARATLLDGVREGGKSLDDEPALGALLRQAKGRLALLAAVAETGGAWTTAQSTAALSDLADAALEASLDFLVRKAAERGTGERHRQKLLFVGSALVGLAITTAIVGVGTAMGLDPRLAKLAAILVSFQTTYLLRRHIVFRAAAA